MVRRAPNVFYTIVSVSYDTNCGPLSDTNSSGRPQVAKYRRNTSMVFPAVVLDISAISGQFLLLPESYIFLFEQSPRVFFARAY